MFFGEIDYFMTICGWIDPIDRSFRFKCVAGIAGQFGIATDGSIKIFYMRCVGLFAQSTREGVFVGRRGLVRGDGIGSACSDAS
jgi:hypothetical protein